jgi:predicted ABC-type ATPase
MNVDRVPDGLDDPGRAAETARLTESPEPAKAARPDPAPDHPTPDRQPPPDQESKPERQPDREPQPDREHPPGTQQADSPEPAEPRSRQEHAHPSGTTEQPEQGHQEKLQSRDGEPENDRRASLESDDRTAPTSAPEDPPKEDQSGHQVSGDVPHEPSEPSKDAAYPSGLRAADEAFRPLTDQEYAEHVTEVRDRLSKAHDEGLSTECQYTIDPDQLRWTRDRRKVHSEIIETIYARAADVPCDYKALIAGGLGGAGKTTVLHEEAGVDLSQYLMINPDDIKEEMVKQNLVPEVEGLSPMEATDLVHEESSAVAKQLARRAYADGKNLIWDITMSSAESTEKRIDDIHRSGYTKVEGIFVDIPVEISVSRTEARHREGHEDFRAGRGLGGRFIPPEVIRSQADPVWGSQNRKTFEGLKHKFDTWTRYDNSVHGRRALLIEHSTRKDLLLRKEEGR